MLTVYCINNKGQRFTKVFDSPYKAKCFILRCRYGHSVFVESFMCDSQEANRELSYVF